MLIEMHEQFAWSLWARCRQPQHRGNILTLHQGGWLRWPSRSFQQQGQSSNPVQVSSEGGSRITARVNRGGGDAPLLARRGQRNNNSTEHFLCTRYYFKGFTHTNVCNPCCNSCGEYNYHHHLHLVNEETKVVWGQVNSLGCRSQAGWP